MAKFILNCAVITSPGTYKYELVDVETAKRWLTEGGWISAIVYPEMAEALKRLTGIRVPVKLTTIRMEVGDEALIFRLAFKPGDPRPDVALKGLLGMDWLLERCEFGILKKIE